ncbi:hypothetical protein UlMin_006627 [Ulmus minor]
MDLGQDSIPASGPFDKSRVLNVKPLRCLVPVFPSAPSGSSSTNPQGAAPFVCASPSGPFPSGVTPFYPFFNSSERGPEQPTQAPSGVPGQSPPFGFNNPISNAVPLNSFRTPPPPAPKPNVVANGTAGSSKRTTRRSAQAQAQAQPQSSTGVEDGYSDNQNRSSQYLDIDAEGKSGKSKRKSLRRASGGQDMNVNSTDAEIEMLAERILSCYNEEYRRAEGNRETIEYVITVYDLFRRRISQMEDVKEPVPGVTRRPDLKAATLMLNKGVRSNVKKRIGVVPGVEIGDIFFFRMELSLVGLHFPTMAGIDYLTVKSTSDEEPLAVSVISSGGYEDNADDPETLIYSGQGGINRRDGEMKDQKLERGNLALEKSLHRSSEVRVIRGIKDPFNNTGKIYVYDGIYKVQESWVEKAKGSGCNVFKYKLCRLPGQADAFKIWKSVEQWKGGTSRIGVILPDLTSGAENIPVSLVNDVDGEKGPAHFTYIPNIKYVNPVNLTVPSTGCFCTGGCVPNNSNCSCVQKNGGSLQYTANGVLAGQTSLIHECGASCVCPPNCKNRVSQVGLKLRLEVFKTKDRGWGLRSWDPIRAGVFISEYAGEVIDHTKVDKLGGDIDDDYIFDATRIPQPVGVLPGDVIEDPKLPFPFAISAKYAGNVARFMNHSCSPNVLWQIVSRENKNESDLHVAFFAVRHIPPMTELTYDYGMVSPEKEQWKKKCLCGSSKCRGYFH